MYSAIVLLVLAALCVPIPGLHAADTDQMFQFLGAPPKKYPPVEGPIGHADGAILFRGYGNMEPVGPDTFHVVRDGKLELVEAPKRAKLPLQIEVRASQFGSAIETFVKSAESVRCTKRIE